jgi:tetratricopeptide (TPR) repeat protein
MQVRKAILVVVMMLIMGKPLLAQTNVTTDNNANYQKALTLYNSANPAEGIPYLESILQTNSTIKPAAYDLLGNIYDKTQQPEKAIESYKEGIKLDPNYQTLHFNLGIAYFRAKKYAEAELSAIEAIKLDPKHANSQRLYGLVTFHQNKRVNALLAFCSFLLLDPQNQRAEEAYTNMQSILSGGVLKTEAAAKDAATLALNSGLSAIIAAGKTKNLQGLALLEYQLKSIFAMAGQLSAQKANKKFFDSYYADFFYKLAQNPQLSTFVKLVSLSGEMGAYKKWQQSNAQQVTALDNWVKATERKF